MVFLLGAVLGLAAPAHASAQWILNANFKNLVSQANLNGPATITVTVSNSGDAASPPTSVNIDVPTGSLRFDSAVSGTSPAISGCRLASSPPAGKDRVTCDLAALQRATGSISADITFTALKVGQPVIEVSMPPAGSLPIPNPVSLSLNVTAPAKLTLAGTSTPGTANPGDRVDYSFSVTNEGPNAAENAFLDVVLDDGLIFDPQDRPSNCVLTSGSGRPVRYRCTWASIPKGEVRTLSFPATVLSAGPTVFVDAVTGSDADPSGSDTKRVSTTVNPGTALKIGKKIDTGTAPISDQQVVNFTLTPAYYGTPPSVQLTVTDTLPANFTAITLTPAPTGGWTCSLSGQTVSCSRPPSAQASRGAMGTISIRATANFLDPTNDPFINNVTNTASLSGSGLATADGLATTSIQRKQLDLQAVKTSPAVPPSGQVVAGTSIPFEITARNGGPTNFVGLLELYDTIGANIEATSITIPAGWTCRKGSPGFETDIEKPPTSPPATTPIASGPLSPPLPPGSVVYCSRSYAPAAPFLASSTVQPVVLTGRVLAEGAFANTLFVRAGQGGPVYADPNAANNTTSFTGSGVTSTVSADNTISKTFVGDHAVWGEEATFLIKPQNTSPDTPSQSVVVTDSFKNLVAGTQLDISFTPGNATNMSCGQANGPDTNEKVLQCAIETLNPCTKDVNCPVITVKARQTGAQLTVKTPRLNTAWIASNGTADPDLGNNSATAAYEVWSQPDVYVRKSSNLASVAVGQEFTFTVTSFVAASPNYGPADVRMTDLLPAGLTLTNAAQLPSGCTATPNFSAGRTQVACNWGVLLPNNTRAVDLRVTADSSLANTTVQNVASVFAETDRTTGIDPGTGFDVNTARASVSVVSGLPDLSVQKVTANNSTIFAIGEDIPYQVKLSNSGSGDARNVTLVDTLPGLGTVFVSGDAPGMNCTFPAAGTPTEGQSITCTIDTLQRGAANALNLSMTLRGTRIAKVVPNTATASLPPGGLEEGSLPNSATFTVGIANLVDLTVVKRPVPGPAQVVLGQPATYTVTVRNNKTPKTRQAADLGDAADVVLTDTLPANMVLDGRPTPNVPAGATTEQSCTGDVGTAGSFTCSFGTMKVDTELTVTVPVRIIALDPPTQLDFTNDAEVTTSSKDVDTTDNRDSATISVTGSAALSGLVFKDLNGNGVQDPGEEGVGQVPVTLRSPGLPDITLTTKGDGSFQFTQLPVGTYSLTRGPIPAGLPLTDGTVTAGNNNGTASNTPPAVVNIIIPTATEFPGYTFALVPKAAGVAISKSVSKGPTGNQDGSFDAEFTLTVENTGGQDLKALAVTDQLAGDPSLFGTHAAAATTPGTYTITGAPAGTCPGLNTAYDGSSDNQPARGFVLARGASCAVSFGIRVMPTNPLPPLTADARYTNQASITGEASDSGDPVTAPSNIVKLSPDLPRLDLAKVMTGYEDKDGSGSITLGDILSYKITAGNSGSIVLTNVKISDDRITPAEKTCASVDPGENCVLTGTYTVTIADVQAKAVVNVATATSNQTPKATATTSTPVVAIIGKNTLTKTALITSARRGERVPYVIQASDVPYNPARIIDVMPPGFVFDEGSARVNGTPVKPVAEGRRLTFDGLVPDANGALKIELTLIVGAAVNPGTWVNQAQLVNPETGQVVATARAPVIVLAEAVFDCSDVIGKVFDDKNRNGYQDEGEPGLPAVRVATVNGLLITADAEGRFSVPCAAIPDGKIGSNFILKLDTATLPTGYQLTTENPRRVRLTRGKAVKLNFGAAMTRVVRLDLNGKVFVEGATALKPKWSTGLDRLVTALEAQSSVLEITYRGDDGALAKARLKSVEQEVLQRWQAVPNHYELSIDTRIVSGGAQ